MKFFIDDLKSYSRSPLPRKKQKKHKKQVSRVRGIVGPRQNVKLVVRRTKLREFMESSTSGSVKFV